MLATAVLSGTSAYTSVKHRGPVLIMRHEQQLRAPKTSLKLSSLRSFAVQYSSMHTRIQAQTLCKWIRRVISSSPLQKLRLICDDESEPAFAFPSFSSLVDHLVQKHASTLRTLDMPTAFIDLLALAKLFSSCVLLEEVMLSSRESCFVSRLYSPGLTGIHS